MTGSRPAYLWYGLFHTPSVPLARTPCLLMSYLRRTYTHVFVYPAHHELPVAQLPHVSGDWPAGHLSVYLAGWLPVCLLACLSINSRSSSQHLSSSCWACQAHIHCVCLCVHPAALLRACVAACRSVGSVFDIFNDKPFCFLAAERTTVIIASTCTKLMRPSMNSTL